MAEAGPVSYGTELTEHSSYPWTLTRFPLIVDTDGASIEFDLTVDHEALRSGFADTNEAAAIGTESPLLVVDDEPMRTSNVYCFADGEEMMYRAIFAAFSPVAEVRLRWQHRASGIDVDEILRREE